MQLNVIKNRNIFFGISATLIIMSLFILIFWKLNYGIDMTWGTQSEYSYKNEINIDLINTKLIEKAKEIKYETKEIINHVNAYNIAWEKQISIVTWYDYIPDWDNSWDTAKKQELLKTLDKYKNDFRSEITKILKEADNSTIEINYTNIGKTFWDYIKDTAVLTLIIAIWAIALYLAWAFSSVVSWISIMSFSLITIVTLFHDVIISTWLYIGFSLIFPEFKIDTYFITALLTILWYSINDTIVVFDRIRWNLSKYIGKKKTLDEVIEISVSDTLRRSIFTSLTLFFVLLTVFLFGPESIRWFILTMMFGTIIWTYSSIYIASPLLYEFNKKKVLWEIQEKIVNINDKIVV